jgi:CMP-N,N'-diacetyllegionaminic acid synthase
MAKAIAFIPARSGSKRIPNKNVRELGGHPLIAYTIRAAIESDVFAAVVVSTDSPEYAAIARHYGATVLTRPAKLAADDSPDIEWVRHALAAHPCDVFSILRPTSPFRTKDTIIRAIGEFTRNSACDSIRAVERVRQHPGKMWRLMQGEGGPISPLQGVQTYTDGRRTVPYHSMPTQQLPEVYVQNASLEIAHARAVKDTGTISGMRVYPFRTVGYEGFDLNTEEDWLLAAALVESGRVELPTITIAPYGRENAA